MTIIQFVYIVGGLIVVLILGLMAILTIERKKGKGLIVRALNMSLFLIRIPDQALHPDSYRR